MPILFVIYGLLCTGSELKFNTRNAPKYLAICTILFVKPKKLHIMMPILVVIYVLLCMGSELTFNTRNAQ